jgi:hypothetical protein
VTLKILQNVETAEILPAADGDRSSPIPINPSSRALCPGPMVQLTVRRLGALARHSSALATESWVPGTRPGMTVSNRKVAAPQIPARHGEAAP